MSGYSKKEFDNIHHRNKKALADIDWYLSPSYPNPIKEQREEWHEQEEAEEEINTLLPSG
jgi:hypothetical protein